MLDKELLSFEHQLYNYNKKKPVQSGTNELLPPYSTHEAASKIGGQRQRKGRTWHCEQVFRNLDEAFDEVGG